MLKLNCKKVIDSRGIHDHLGHLQQNGISRHLAHRLIDKVTQRISLEILEKLCIALNCTPNDLLEWTPDKNNKETEWTAMSALKPKPQNANMSILLSRLPFDKLNEIVKAVNETQKK